MILNDQRRERRTSRQNTSEHGTDSESCHDGNEEKGQTKGPYKNIFESDTTEKTALTEQAAAPNPGEPIEIGNDNNSNGRSQDQQECENNPDNQLFSAESDDDNDDNDPDDDNNPND